MTFTWLRSCTLNASLAIGVSVVGDRIDLSPSITHATRIWKQGMGPCPNSERLRHVSAELKTEKAVPTAQGELRANLRGDYLAHRAGDRCPEVFAGGFEFVDFFPN